MLELIIETLFDNTAFHEPVMGSPETREKFKVVIDELNTLLNGSDNEVPSKTMKALVSFIEHTGIDYMQMYVVDKKVVDDVTIYTMGHVNSESQFNVRIKNVNNTYYVSINAELTIE